MTLLAAICFLLVAGCKDFPGADGRYATPARGGWDNFRAEVPYFEHGMLAMGPIQEPETTSISKPGAD
jgi:hypothetical protein